MVRLGGYSGVTDEAISAKKIGWKAGAYQHRTPTVQRKCSTDQAIA